jgi:hypothetical protein
MGARQSIKKSTSKDTNDGSLFDNLATTIPKQSSSVGSSIFSTNATTLARPGNAKSLEGSLEVQHYWKQRQLLHFRALQPLFRGMAPTPPSANRDSYYASNIHDRITSETEGVDPFIFINDGPQVYYGTYLSCTYSPSGRWVLIGRHQPSRAGSDYRVFTVADIGDPLLQLACTPDVYDQQQQQHSRGSSSSGSEAATAILSKRLLSTCHISWNKESMQLFQSLVASKAHREYFNQRLCGHDNTAIAQTNPGASLIPPALICINDDDYRYAHHTSILPPINTPAWCNDWGSGAHWKWASNAPSTLVITEQPPSPMTESQSEIEWCARQPTRPSYQQVLPSRDTDRIIWIDMIDMATETQLIRALVGMIFEYLDG